MDNKRMPVIFIGHGSPTNAIEDNDFTRSLKKLGEKLPRPRAILCVSAHWMTEGSWITYSEKPKTIHDFYGFPQALFDIQYPSPGSPSIAEEVQGTIVDPKIILDKEDTWGIDHGTWSVLRHMYPKADVPTLQLSVYISQPGEYHFKLGKELSKLREMGILVIGSGNIVHNLRQVKWGDSPEPYDWAIEFDEWAKQRILKRDFDSLTYHYNNTEIGRLSVPSPDHYYPFLYTLGAVDERDEIQFEFEGIQNSSVSMRTISFGLGK